MVLQVVQLEEKVVTMTKEKDVLAEQFDQECGKAETSETRCKQVGSTSRDKVRVTHQDQKFTTKGGTFESPAEIASTPLRFRCGCCDSLQISSGGWKDLVGIGFDWVVLSVQKKNRRSTQTSYKKRLSAQHLVPDFVEITGIVTLSIDLQAIAEAESLKEELEVVRKVKAAADESLALLLEEKQQLQEAHDSNLKVKGEISSKLTGR
jgi:hypothetical protein